MAHDDDGATTERAAAFRPGSMVDHYQVMRLLDRGGMGEVYVARDVQLGRKVALKIVHAELLGSDKTLRQFMFEARSIAKFSHPHIVTIYGVGSHQGCPYVALELVEGQNLRDRLREQGETLGLKESLRIGLAIAEALGEAHARGILHRDLKPANVVIARDGRPRVVDFGLARRVADDAPDSARGQEAAGGEMSWGGGTPAYMAPEQWAEHECSGATDMWAFGVMLFELCAGRRPFEGDDLADLCARVCRGPEPTRLDDVAAVPRALADLVAACLERDPDRRPAASEAAAALRGMLAGETRSLAVGDSPFRGLLPFGEKHASLFFGRDAEVAAFVERVRLQAVLPVVGPSGAGKSSFVHAGIIPRLREQGLWLVLSLRPGARPFRALAAKLTRFESDSEPTITSDPATADAAGHDASVRVDETARVLADEPRRLAMELRALASRRGASVLLFVDQLEELFTLVADKQVRRRFMRALCSAADDPDDPVRVVFTARDDFLGRLATDAEVRDALGHVTVVQSLEADALREILLGPLRLMDYRFEDPKMVDDIVDAVQGSPAGLPLLQFSAQRLWELRDQHKKLLLRAAYDRMGGVEGALAKHADGVLDGLSPDELDLARAVLLRLVTPDRTRRVLLRSEALEGLRAEALVTRLTAARLITVRKTRKQGRDDATLELAHESLIRSWRTLARWIDESAEEVVVISELAASADRWEKRGRRKEELLRGAALTEAVRTLEHGAREIALPIRELIQASRDEERRQRRARRLTLAAGFTLLAGLAAAAVVAALFIAEKEKEARAERDRAEQHRGLVLLESASEAYGSRALYEARAKLRMALEIDDHPSARALWWRLSGDPLVMSEHLARQPYDVALSPDGKRLAVAAQDAIVYLYDTETGQPRRLRGHGDQVMAVAYANDGERLASGTWSGEVRLWKAQDGVADGVLAKRGSPEIVALRFSPDGKALTALDIGGGLRTWDIASRRQIYAVRASADRGYGIAYSEDGSLIAVAAGASTVKLHDARSGAMVRELQGGAPLLSVAFSRDDVLASGARDGSIHLWNARSGAVLKVIASGSRPVQQLAFGSDHRLFAIAEGLLACDTRSGAVSRPWPAREGDAKALSLDRSGRLLATCVADGRVRLFDMGVESVTPTASGHTHTVHEVAFSRDGRQLVSGALGEGAVRIWDPKTGEEQRVLDHDAGARVVLAPPDDRLLITVSEVAVAVHDLHEGTSRRFDGHTDAIFGLDVSPDGSVVVSSSRDTTARLWDLARGQSLRTLRGHTDVVYDAIFSPDGKYLVTVSKDRTARLWDARTGEEQDVLEGSFDAIRSAAFDPSGETIAIVSVDGGVRVWKPKSDEVKLVGRHRGRAYGVAFHPSGDRLASAGADGTARIWKLDGGGELVLRGHKDEVNRAVFSPDGAWLATCSDDTTVRVWHADTGRPYWRAPVLLSSPPRMLSHRGWQALGHKNTPEPPTSRWRTAIERDAAFVMQTADVSCMQTYDDHVELWDPRRDERLARKKLLDVQQVFATESGCVARTPEAVGLLTSAEWRVIEAGAKPSAVGPAPGGFAIAAEGRVTTFSGDGRSGTSCPAGERVTALTYSHSAMVVGYADGDLALCGSVSPSFADVPASAPVTILEGPNETIIVGYASGVVGIWNQRDGTRLAHARMHGSVIHLLLEAHKLYAASDLGAHLVWDLSAFYRDYCELLREVWSRVPVMWRNGRAELEAPPADHRCSP